MRGPSASPLERMSRTCPACGTTFRRVGIRFFARRPGVKWYVFSAPRFFCRTCRVELRSVVRPVGWVLYGAMTLSATIYVLYWFLHPQQLLRYRPLPELGVLLVVLPFVVPCALWAETYVLDNDPKLAKS